jgi:hypothetical protein|tara:strand:+ start:90 stop:257 length:168 start_codon:yes stop_codon:yes gene_type:complete
MPSDKQHLNNFVESIFDDNFAKAKDDLQSAVTEKIKTRMKSEMDHQTTSNNAKGA